MDEVEWWEFDTPAEMAEQAAGDVAFVIESAIEAHGGARIALTGGRTPDVIYEALLKKEIDWSKVTLLPTDDRLVPLGDALSNHAKLQRFFGKTGAEIVSLVDEAALGDYQEAGRLGDERLVDRVTLTAAAIAAARAVMIVLTGDEKRAVVEKAIEAGPLSSTPIGRVVAEVDAAIDIFWSR